MSRERQEQLRLDHVRQLQQKDRDMQQKDREMQQKDRDMQQKDRDMEMKDRQLQQLRREMVKRLLTGCAHYHRVHYLFISVGVFTCRNGG